MPIFEKPLSELKVYSGTNPRPADFDAYWERGLAEMHALGTECTLTPSWFQTPHVQCDDLYFTGCGAARAYTPSFCVPAAGRGVPRCCTFMGIRAVRPHGRRFWPTRRRDLW